jgi:carbamoyl-phosphate synthase large subunit
MTLRVAITGVSGDVGRGALLGLRSSLPDEEATYVIGFDASTDFSHKTLLDCFVQLPMVRTQGYVDDLVAALRAHAIDVLLPGIDSEIAVLSDARQQLAACGTKVVLAPRELIEAASDKLLTARFLMARGISAPATWDAGSPEESGFPLVAKPRRGHGSRGVTILRDKAALQAFLDTRPLNYCVQRYIDGPEITVGLLYDSNGVMRDAIAMERSLKDGRTVRARVVDDPEMLQFIAYFGREIPGVGAVNAQLRWHKNDGPMVFEINPRLSGSTDMRVSVGFNDPLRLAYHFGRGAPIVPAQPRKAIIYRKRTELLVESC